MSYHSRFTNFAYLSEQSYNGGMEPYYDPDFCIYNDVIVLDPDLHVTIYGYPSEVFPPTDFHSATLAGESDVYIKATTQEHETAIAVSEQQHRERFAHHREELP